MLLKRTYQLAHRAGIIFDARMIQALMRYRPIKQRFYDELWSGAVATVGAEATPWQFGLLRIQRDGLTTVTRQ